jgi:hypothetical protein
LRLVISEKDEMPFLVGKNTILDPSFKGS